MTTFHIDYSVSHDHTVTLNIHQHDGAVKSYPMSSRDDCHWQYELLLPPDHPSGILSYHYSIMHRDEMIAEEWVGHGHTIYIHHADHIQRHDIYDRWIALPADERLYADDFTHCLHQRPLTTNIAGADRGAFLRLKLRAPQLRSDERLILVGAHPVLGEWQVERGIPCYEQQANEWYCDINTDYLAGEDLAFKFAIVGRQPIVRLPFHIPGTPEPKDTTIWEQGDNRHFIPPRTRQGEIAEFEIPDAFFPIPLPRVIGVYADLNQYPVNLRQLIDWVHNSKLNILQISGTSLTKQQIYEATHYAAQKRVLLKTSGDVHPLSPLIWWDTDSHSSNHYYHNVLGRHDSAPHPLPTWLARDIILRHILRSDMYCIIPLPHWLCLTTPSRRRTFLSNVRLRDDIAEIISYTSAL